MTVSKLLTHPSALAPLTISQSDSSLKVFPLNGPVLSSESTGSSRSVCVFSFLYPDLKGSPSLPGSCWSPDCSAQSQRQLRWTQSRPLFCSLLPPSSSCSLKQTCSDSPEQRPVSCSVEPPRHREA